MGKSLYGHCPKRREYVGYILSSFNYPNARNDPAGAIPVYIVSPPTPGPPWPNKQNTGAIPVNFVAQPTTPNVGAIPVRIVAGTGPGPKWPSDQGQDAGAIPVYDDAGGMPVWAASGTPPVGLPVNTTPPSIIPVGPVNYGTLLTADPGVWTNSPATYLYQWTRSGVNIANATTNTYTTSSPIDGNRDIGVNVIAQNTTGNGAQIQSSNLVHVLGPPVNIVAPSISPIGPVNVGDTLTMSTGTWTNNPTSYIWSWRSNGVGISGASAQTYIPVAADLGTTIDGVMLAMNADGSGLGTATSNQVSVN
jgi:hypothetical protein